MRAFRTESIRANHACLSPLFGTGGARERDEPIDFKTAIVPAVSTLLLKRNRKQEVLLPQKLSKVFSN